MNNLTISPTINYMPPLPSVSIPLPFGIKFIGKWVLILLIISVVIFFITQIKVVEGIQSTNNYCDNLNYQRWQKNWPVYCAMRGLSKDCVSAEGVRDGRGYILGWECGE